MLGFQHGVGVERNWRDGVVDVMSDAAGHLPENPEPLLLHYRLLRVAQLFVRGLQRGMELRLVGGEGYVLAQLAEELTFAAGEAIGPAPRADQDAKHLAFNLQGRDDQGA